MRRAKTTQLQLQIQSWQKRLESDLPGIAIEKWLKRPESLDVVERSVFRGLCLSSLHFTTVFALGYDLLSLPGGVHWEMCQQLQTAERPQLHLRYRGFYKSTIATIAHPIWRVMCDPGHYSFLLVTSDEPLGLARMRDIKKRLMRPQVQVLFPELALQRGETADRAFSVVGREEDGPSFMMRTTQQPLAGRHPYHLHFDDLVNEQNYKSRERQDELRRYYDESQPTVRQTRLVTLTATPYAHYDATHHVIDVMYPELLDVFITPVRGWCEMDEAKRVVHHDTGEYAFPVDERVDHEDQWDDRKFEEEKRKYRKHPFIFRAQYLMDTSAVEGRGFHRRWLRYRPLNDLRYYTRYMSLDPASGAHSGSRPALAIVAYGYEGDLQVLVTRDDYEGLPELLEDMFRLYEVYRPAKVGIETYAGIGATFWEQVQRQMRERGVYMPLEKQTHGSRSKDEHILEALQPPYQWGGIWHSEELRGGRYEAQLLDFPSSEYMDLLDVVAYAVKLALQYGYRGPAPGEATQTDDVKRVPDFGDRLRERIENHGRRAVASSGEMVY